MPDSSLSVGYILKQYPRLSETFILNEILGLEARGVDVSIYSLRHATEGRFHPGIAAVRGSVHYLGAADKGSFIAGIEALTMLRVDRLPEVLDFLHRLPQERRSRLLQQALEIAERATAQGVDHLHAHFLTVAAHTAHIVWRLTGIPYSVTAHAKDIYRDTVDWDIAAVVARNASTVVTVCDANLRYLEHRLDGSGARLTRIYNGLPAAAVRLEPVDREPGLILGVGRLVEKKGFDILIEAMALHAADGVSSRCVIVGDGDERAPLERRVDELGVRDRVTFAGATGADEVERWMERAQVLVAPCRLGRDGNQDALPTVLLEALRCSLPVVTTPVAGIPEIVSPGVEGLVVACEDASALAAASADLLADDRTRARMGAAGPVKLASRFDRSQTIGELIAAFRSPALVA